MSAKVNSGPGGTGVATDAGRAPLALDRTTMLAVERNRLAEERTLMAWLRTALSMIGFGITLVKFVEWTARGGEFGGTATGARLASGSTQVGLLMIAIGTVALVLAVLQHRRRMRAFAELGLVPERDLVAWVATVVALLGVFSLVVLVLGV